MKIENIEVYALYIRVRRNDIKKQFDTVHWHFMVVSDIENNIIDVDITDNTFLLQSKNMQVNYTHWSEGKFYS